MSSPASAAQAGQPRDAGPPFHVITPDLTVILRSSDEVDFFVLRPILSQVSVVFRDMFELPGHGGASENPDSDGPRRGIPLIEVTETSTTLDILLRLCYPVEAPDPSNLELKNIRHLLEARRKYMIEAFDHTIKVALSRIAESQPFAVFALASRYALEDAANDAAKQMLCFPENDVLDESFLKDITAEQYHRLLKYRRQCVARATTKPQLMWFNSLSSSHPPSPVTSLSCRTQFHFFFVSSPPRSLWVPHWWTAYLRQAQQLLKVRPSGRTVESPDLLEHYFECTELCTDCREEGKTALRKFSSALAQEVEKAIAQVQKPYCSP